MGDAVTEQGPGGSPQWAAPGAPTPPHRVPAVPPAGAGPDPWHPWEPARRGFYVGGPGTPPPPPPQADPPWVRGRPARVEPVPGTEFGIVIASIPPTFSGQATGSLVAGVGSVAVSLVVGCFGVVGGSAGWGVLVSGAFAILAGLLGLAGVGLGLVAVRLIKASRGRFSGRGVAISGIACGGAGVVLTALGMFIALATLVAV